MKKFTIPCDFSGQKVPFELYIGEPDNDLHPLHYQRNWLSQQRYGTIPKAVMDAFERLQKIAAENNQSFEELCVYALSDEAKTKNPELPRSAEKP